MLKLSFRKLLPVTLTRLRYIQLKNRKAKRKKINKHKNNTQYKHHECISNYYPSSKCQNTKEQFSHSNYRRHIKHVSRYTNILQCASHTSESNGKHIWRQIAKGVERNLEIGWVGVKEVIGAEKGEMARWERELKFLNTTKFAFSVTGFHSRVAFGSRLFQFVYQ